MNQSCHTLSFIIPGFSFSAFSSLLFLFHTGVAQPGEWTWMKGDSSTALAHFGTQGIADPLNKPPGFYEPAEWKDLDGNLWLFGGLNDINEYGDVWKFDIATSEWTWMKGSGLGAQSGIYGTQGVSSPANNPGSRAWGTITWVDLEGNFWLYGGWGYDASGSWGTLSDLWKYNVSTNEWTWINGSNQTSQLPVYGTQGVPSINNQPGARSETNASWVDNDGNLWLFGGWNGLQGFNDLWKFDVITLEWTWVKGANFGNQAGIYGTKGVSNINNVPGARLPYGKWKDAAGNFWQFAGYDAVTATYRNDVWKYDPATNEWTWMSGLSSINPGNSLSASCDASVNNYPRGRHENRACWSDCGGHFYTFGGNTDDGIYSDLWTFDSNTLEWTLINGSFVPNLPGLYGTQGVAAPNNYPAARWGAIAWMDNNCNLWLFGGQDGFTGICLNDLWKFQPDPSCPGTFVCNTNCNPNALAINSSATTLCQKFCIDFFDGSTNNPTAWLWQFPGGTPSSSTAQNPAQICYQAPGVFDVTLITTNANGNDTLTLNNYITVYATPPFPAITQNGYTLTSSPATGYQWQFNNVDIPGATNQSYDVQQSGYYTVFITDQNGCVSSTTTYILIEGIEEVNLDANVLVYPNPSDGNFIVEFSCAKASENKSLNCSIGEVVSIKIYNTIGQIVFSSEESRSIGTSPDWVTEIDLSSDAKHRVATGVFFIEISAENSSDKMYDVIARRKIIIEK